MPDNISEVRISFPGTLLREGFWLYVWRVATSKGEVLLYVGRTGDSSSPNAAPPYRRLGQHLGTVKASNMLRTHLERRGIDPQSCLRFDFIAHGPYFEKQADMASHKGPRNIMAAQEKALAESLTESGYVVMNTVNSRHPLNEGLWKTVCDAFAKDFPELRASSKH